MSLISACAEGNLSLVERLLDTDPSLLNAHARDGTTPLSIAAFWGHAHIVSALLRRGADVNLANSGTKWTALHCAAFQGHGPVLLELLESDAQLANVDAEGRTAADFASATDAIWPLFAAKGCRRTAKSDLVRMGIVRKVDDAEAQLGDTAHFSRPGSAYVVQGQSLGRRPLVAPRGGDVLSED
eukprot:m.238549 g.238549  ORF g.238549 m.238549 type:complete len:184 (+) comp21834_c0_seq1:30-581(+)